MIFFVDFVQNGFGFRTGYDTRALAEQAAQRARENGATLAEIGQSWNSLDRRAFDRGTPDRRLAF